MSLPAVRSGRAAATSATPLTDADREAAFAAAQKEAPRPSLAEEARTLVQTARCVLFLARDPCGGGQGARSAPLSSPLPHARPLPRTHPTKTQNSLGVLSTLSSSGAPAGSVVQYAADADGRLIMSLSSLSAHTRELAADGRCALTVLAPGFASMADARVTLTGTAASLPDGDAAARTDARDVYMAAHPGAFWADFGDFSWWTLDPTAPGAAARAVLGFGRAGSVPGAQWAGTAADPVTPFSGPVCGHMNDDHGDAVVAMVRATGLPGKIVRAAMKKVDRLGWDGVAEVEAADAAAAGSGRRPGVGPPTVAVPVRVTFPRPAEDRKALKEVLVEMTRAAAAAGGGE